MPAVRLDARGEPGLHAVRADGGRGVPGHHGGPRGPGHRGHLREQHRAHPAGLRRGGHVRAQGRGHRPLHGAEHAHRGRPGLPALGARASWWPRTSIKDIPDEQLCIATTGAQGEPMAGLARMANRDHRFVEIVPGDTVIVSASPIPGNEEYVARTIDNLFKVGANVYYHAIKRAHVSGHASQEELKLMLNLTKPRDVHPHPRRVPDARPARPPGRRGGRRAREHLHHRERPVDRVLRRRHAPGAARAWRRATCSWTGSRWARWATSCCATAARSPTTACSWSWSPSTSRPATWWASPRS